MSIGVVIGIACGGLVLADIIASLWIHSRQGGEARHVTGDSTDLNGSGVSFTQIWNDSVLLFVRINDEGIQDIEHIGKGAYGDVWLVKYRNSRLLISNRLRKGEPSSP